jgi:hypothetical protein
VYNGPWHACSFQIPYVYDFIAELCRHQAQDIQNHYNPTVHITGLGDAQQRKYLGDGQTFKSPRYCYSKGEYKIRYNLLYKAWTDRDIVHIVHTVYIINVFLLGIMHTCIFGNTVRLWQRIRLLTCDRPVHTSQWVPNDNKGHNIQTCNLKSDPKSQKGLNIKTEWLSVTKWLGLLGSEP